MKSNRWEGGNISSPFFDGRHLHACRVLAGFKQGELAREAKISDRAVRYWEARASMPQRGVALALIAKAIRARGVTITESGCQLDTRKVSSASDFGSGELEL